MFNLETKKECEIQKMVYILEQIDLPDILLLTRDASTLLLRCQVNKQMMQSEIEKEGE